MAERVIRELKLRNYKGFQSFALPFRSTTVVVGPNNAGKSTAIEGLRACAAMARHASRLSASELFEDRGEHYRGWPLNAARLGLDTENLRHEFRPVETRLELRATGNVVLRAVWPDEDEGDPFFYISGSGGMRLTMPKQVRAQFPSIVTIPTFSPVEPHERVLRDDYVRDSRSSHLASRHFRNQLRLLLGKPSTTIGHKDALDDFLAFARTWLSELELERPELRQESDGPEIDVFYHEGPTPKEVAWAGDGVQVFLQILLHIFNAVGVEVIVLDEPDVYLHADLQRRLIRLLDGINSQVIMATHSPEVVVAAPPDAVVWVDRSRRSGVRAPDPSALSGLAGSIGTQFNLKLARVLRSRLALFVEGKDLEHLALLARTAGAQAIVTEEGLATVPLGGATNWQRLEGFGWLAESLLEGAVKGMVLLDRDYHSTDAVNTLTTQLNEAGLQVHIWKRKELESYLLNPAAIARLTGADPAWVAEVLAEESDAFRSYVHGRMTTQRFEERIARKWDWNRVYDECGIELDLIWSDPEARAARCPAKDLLARVNERLQGAGHDAVSAGALSRHLRLDEIPEEMSRVLLHIDELARAEG